MIGRFSTVTWMVFFFVAASMLYLVKYRVQDIRDEVTDLQLSIHKEQEAIDLLRAEWSYLNRPDRLEALAAQYLTMAPMSPVAMVSWDAVPLKVQAVANVSDAPAGGR